MTRFHENVCAAGDSQLTQLLWRLCRAADRPDETSWSTDEMYVLGNWPLGAHELFVEVKPPNCWWGTCQV